ncbi:MAG TPA: glycosyltransferase, partial [Chitinophagaceae bacterium]|nr:glycosyltransferase [Chitinophagaceae bacterium]
AYFNKASLIVSHAGMGNIISALEREKPILVLPRLAQYGEHRNDHQMATAKVFEKLNYVYVAYNEQELQKKLQSVYQDDLKPLHKIGAIASPELINSIKAFITKP